MDSSHINLWSQMESTPRVFREVADIVAKPLSIISENSWRSGNTPDDGKGANAILIYK